MPSTYTKPGDRPTTNAERIRRYKQRQREERGRVELRVWASPELLALIDREGDPCANTGAAVVAGDGEI